jgi:hypothetical protein
VRRLGQCVIVLLFLIKSLSLSPPTSFTAFAWNKPSTFSPPPTFDCQQNFSLPLENGFPLNNVRVRGQTDPYTQHKRDGAPLRNGTTAWPWATPDPLEAGDRSVRKSRRTLRSRLGGGQPYLRALDDRFQPAVPPADDFGGPLRKGLPSATAELTTAVPVLLNPPASLTRRLAFRGGTPRGRPSRRARYQGGARGRAHPWRQRFCRRGGGVRGRGLRQNLKISELLALECLGATRRDHISHPTSVSDFAGQKPANQFDISETQNSTPRVVHHMAEADMKLVLFLPLFAFFAQYLHILNPSSPVVLLTLFSQDVVVSCREP